MVEMRMIMHVLLCLIEYCYYISVNMLVKVICRGAQKYVKIPETDRELNYHQFHQECLKAVLLTYRSNKAYELRCIILYYINLIVNTIINYVNFSDFILFPT